MPGQFIHDTTNFDTHWWMSNLQIINHKVTSLNDIQNNVTFHIARDDSSKGKRGTMLIQYIRT